MSNVREFPQKTNEKPEAPLDDSVVLFSFGGRRFAIQWTITELKCSSAEVILIKKRHRKDQDARRR